MSSDEPNILVFCMQADLATHALNVMKIKWAEHIAFLGDYAYKRANTEAQLKADKGSSHIAESLYSPMLKALPS